MIDEPRDPWLRQDALKRLARDRTWEIEAEQPVSPLPAWVAPSSDDFLSAMSFVDGDWHTRYVEAQARFAAAHYRALGAFPDGFFEEEWVDHMLSRVDEILGEISPVVRFTLQDNVPEEYVDYPNADATAAVLHSAAVAARGLSSPQLSGVPNRPPESVSMRSDGGGALPSTSDQRGWQGRPQLVPCLVACALLFFALGDQPYGYFTVLRWVVTIAAAISAYVGFKAANVFAAWVFVAMAVLFNPIAPVFLERSTWQTMDMLAAVILIYAATLRMPLPTTGQVRAPVNGA